MVDTGTAILIATGIFVLVVTVIVLVLMALNLKNIGSRLFALGVAALLLIGIMGMNVSLIQNEVTGFTEFGDTYSSIYLVFLYLGGAGMLGLILWLIYYSLNLFNKSRGRIPDDD